LRNRGHAATNDINHQRPGAATHNASVSPQDSLPNSPPTTQPPPPTGAVKSTMGKAIASPSPVLTPKTFTPGSAGGTYSTKLWDERPTKYAKNVITRVCVFIFVLALCSELTHFGVVQSLKNFFVKLGWSNKGSNSMKTTFDSICQFSCIIMGYVADEKLGKFKTLLTASGMNVVGLIPVAVAALPAVLDHLGTSKALFNIGLFVGISLTQTSLMSLSVSLGGDQFSPDASPEEKAKFFSIHYWSGNFGTFLAYLLFPSISIHGVGAISAEYGYFTVYVAGFILMLVIVTLLLVSRPRYVKVPPTSHSIAVVIRIVVARAKQNFKARMIVLGTVSYLLAVALNVPAAFLSDNGNIGHNISYVSGALSLFGTLIWVYFGRDSSFMDGADERNGGQFDHELIYGVKQVIRVLPFNAFNVFWWMCQNQRGNNQSMIQQTDVRLGNGLDSYQVPGPTVQMFNPLGAVFFVPLLYKVVFPLYKKIVGKESSKYGRILTGYFIASLAMFWSGVYEIIRRDAGPITYLDASGETQDLLNDGGGQVMNNIKWYTALGQYFLVSLAGAFIVIPSYDICYSEVPQRMRSTSVALSFFVMSIGSTLQSSLVLLFGNYITTNLNNGHMEYLYYCLGAIMFAVALVYVVVMNEMKLGTLPPLGSKGEPKREGGEESGAYVKEDSRASETA
jgi:peptide/histidine transporter 3/4